MIVSVFFSIWKRKWTKNTPVPVLVIFSDFFDKKVCSWFDVFLTRILQEIFFCQVLARNIFLSGSCKKYFSVRFLQEIFFCQVLARNIFLSGSCKKYFFCQVLARFVFFCQDLARIVFIFNQRSEDKVEVFCKVRFALVQILE